MYCHCLDIIITKINVIKPFDPYHLTGANIIFEMHFTVLFVCLKAFIIIPIIMASLRANLVFTETSLLDYKNSFIYPFKLVKSSLNMWTGLHNFFFGFCILQLSNFFEKIRKTHFTYFNIWSNQYDSPYLYCYKELFYSFLDVHDYQTSIAMDALLLAVYFSIKNSPCLHYIITPLIFLLLLCALCL